jgi:hypothetical protein
MNDITEEMMTDWIEEARDLLERAKKEIDRSVLLKETNSRIWDNAYELYVDINMFLNNVWRTQ